jgi:hypothetical protein
MNRDDVMRMAREAELFATTSVLIKFAALVAAAEREECADMADATGDPDLADAIRARGQE